MYNNNNLKICHEFEGGERETQEELEGEQGGRNVIITALIYIIK